MTFQEKKYKVDSFSHVTGILRSEHAKKVSTSKTTHYYAQLEGKDVVKIVESDEKCEIHRLEENDGKFDLVERIPVDGVKAGFKWMRQEGYGKVDVLTMESTSYEYGSGFVRLYTVNGEVLSIILDFPPGKHEEVEEVLGLQNAEVIALPYNKYLAGHNLGKTKTL